MSQRDDQVSLRHMLDHSNEAVELTRGKTPEDLASDRLLQLALARLVEIVGEAAGRVSGEVQRRHSEIPWPQMVSMRNRLIHGYDFVDLDILWKTIEEDLPLLVQQLNSALAPEPK